MAQHRVAAPMGKRGFVRGDRRECVFRALRERLSKRRAARRELDRRSAEAERTAEVSRGADQPGRDPGLPAWRVRRGAPDL
jgi:hypothetical protein